MYIREQLEIRGVFIDWRVGATMANTQHNRLLASLSESDRDLLSRYSYPALLRLRQCVEAANRSAKEVFFPYRGIVSVVAVTQDRRHQSEIGLIGRDGMTGLAILLGSGSTPCDAFVQLEGDGVAIASEDLDRCITNSPSLRATLVRYAHIFTIQTAHTALANARGTLEQRLARWLLMARDRTLEDELPLTHEFLSYMLGVRRAGVTVALNALCSRRLVDLSRRSIVIIDRPGLERCSDGLYGIPERELDRLLPVQGTAV
jgi:CRP-like cAMP-binding protein